jgi:hypothetical protein
MNIRMTLITAGLTISLPICCNAQGTLTYTFEGTPRGLQRQYGVYKVGQMEFGMTYGPGSVWLSGGGVAGQPDNGTGYLEIPDGYNSIFTFGFNVIPFTGPLYLFDLVSFDAAPYGGYTGETLEVVGHQERLMAPPMLVTNYITLNNPGFQTFTLDSRFTGLFQVDVYNGSWCLDNLVISGVPEPSAAAFTLTAIVCSLCSRGRFPRHYAH